MIEASRKNQGRTTTGNFGEASWSHTGLRQRVERGIQSSELSYPKSEPV